MEITLSSLNGKGNVPLHALECGSAGNKSHVTLLHGLGEHSARYLPFAKALVNAGYNVHLHDHRNHGRSGGRRGMIHRFDDLLADAEQRINTISKQYGSTFVFGHSLGSLALIRLLAEKRIDIPGAIVTGAALCPGESLNPLFVYSAKLVGRIVPRLPLQRLDPQVLSRDTKLIDEHLGDPFWIQKRIPAGTLAQILTAIEKARKHIGKIDTPMLIMHGTADALTSPDSSKFLFERIASADKKLSLMTGLKHELLNEIERQQVIDEIVSWLDKRC